MVLREQTLYMTSSHLIIVVMAMEKWLLSEYHTSQHATQAPHIQTVIIHLYKTRRTIQFLMNKAEQTSKTNRVPPPPQRWYEHSHVMLETNWTIFNCSAQCSTYSNWDTAISRTAGTLIPSLSARILKIRACFYFHCRLQCYKSLRNVWWERKHCNKQQKVWTPQGPWAGEDVPFSRTSTVSKSPGTLWFP